MPIRLYVVATQQTGLGVRAYTKLATRQHWISGIHAEPNPEPNISRFRNGVHRFGCMLSTNSKQDLVYARTPNSQPDNIGFRILMPSPILNQMLSVQGCCTPILLYVVAKHQADLLYARTPT